MDNITKDKLIELGFTKHDGDEIGEFFYVYEITRDFVLYSNFESEANDNYIVDTGELSGGLQISSYTDLKLLIYVIKRNTINNG